MFAALNEGETCAHAFYSRNNQERRFAFIRRSLPQVGTVSQGKTEEEVLKNLKEATELYLEEVTDPSHQTLHLA